MAVAPVPRADDDAKIKAAPRASKAQWSQLANLVEKGLAPARRRFCSTRGSGTRGRRRAALSSGALTAVVAKDEPACARSSGVSLWRASRPRPSRASGRPLLARGDARRDAAAVGALRRHAAAGYSSFFDATSTGELASRLSGDAAKVSDVVSFNLNIIARQTLQAIGGCV